MVYAAQANGVTFVPLRRLGYMFRHAYFEQIMKPLYVSLLTCHTLFNMLVNTSLWAFPVIQPTDKHIGFDSAIVMYFIIISA